MLYQPVGAQMLQCALDGVELFYCSPLRLSGSPIRGGVPVLFPQFGERGSLPKHGFVRNALWSIGSETIKEGLNSIVFDIDSIDLLNVAWPHQAALRLQIVAGVDFCRFSLSVTNVGTSTFSWTGGLHPYIAVSDVRSVKIDGLAAQPVEDRHDTDLCRESNDGPHFTEEVFERLYTNSPKVELRDGARHMTLETRGFSEWMIWNPGREGGKQLADLPDGDWSKFICIEPVIASQPYELRPGQVFLGELTLRLVWVQEKAIQHYKILFSNF